MESKTHAPSFTVSLRGYDRMEVDEYLDSLAEALAQVEEAEDRCQGLRAHVDRLNARIAELEGRIQGEVPKSGAVLGERISMILSSAEEAAAETVARAEAQAEEILRSARTEAARVEDQARGASVRSAEQARRTEAAARAEATEIVAEAEARASARTRQIEQWAEQVVSHTRAEEARMLQERADRIAEVEAEIQGLVDSRDDLAASLDELRNTISGALDGIGGPPARPRAIEPEHTPIPVPDLDAPVESVVVIDAAAVAAEQAAETEPEPDAESPVIADGHEVADDATGEIEALHIDLDLTDHADETEDDSLEMPWPAAFSPIKDLTGEIELPDPEFDTKFDAWMTESDGEPRHFKRI